MSRLQKITFGEMRESGVRDVLIHSDSCRRARSVNAIEKCQKVIDSYIARTGRFADQLFEKLQAHRIRRAQVAAKSTNEVLKAANANDLSGMPPASSGCAATNGK